VPATGYGAVTLFRLAESSEIPSNATALTIHDFLVRQLTGVAVTDPTDASSWGIYDVQHGTGWLPGVEEILNIPPGALPQIRPTGSIAGKLLPEIASKIGLPDGLPVTVALGDNQASFLGSVPSIAESVLFNIGTGGQMSVASDVYALDYDLDTRPLVSGQWLRVGASLCGGSAFKILANFFTRVGSAFFDSDILPEMLYDKMTALADLLPDGDEYPMIASYFRGTRADASRTAQIVGLRDFNFTPAHLTRALIRGMVNELVSYYENSHSGQPQPRFIVGSGNGLRRNSVLRRELSLRFGSEILLPPYEEEAAVGAALVAGVGVGIFSDWNDAGHRLYMHNKRTEPSGSSQ
jgi:sedoheptulokinase